MEKIVTCHAHNRVPVADATDSLVSVSVRQVYLDRPVTCHVLPIHGDQTVHTSVRVRRDILMVVIQR